MRTERDALSITTTWSKPEGAASVEVKIHFIISTTV